MVQLSPQDSILLCLSIPMVLKQMPQRNFLVLVIRQMPYVKQTWGLSLQIQYVPSNNIFILTFIFIENAQFLDFILLKLW